MHQYIIIFSKNIINFIAEKLLEANVIICSESVMNHITKKLRVSSIKNNYYESL